MSRRSEFSAVRDCARFGPAPSQSIPIAYRWVLTFVCHWPILPASIDGSDVSRPASPPELLPGTLDLLILRALRDQTLHGYGIAQRLRDVSKDVLQVGESSLYPALQRLLLDGYVRAEWGKSENNRRARFYTLTAMGRKQLAQEQDEFERMIGAIHAVLRFA
jgi:transcriptional regulator